MFDPGIERLVSRLKRLTDLDDRLEILHQLGARVYELIEELDPGWEDRDFWDAVDWDDDDDD